MNAVCDILIVLLALVAGVLMSVTGFHQTQQSKGGFDVAVFGLLLALGAVLYYFRIIPLGGL